jgi:hypothetical protein
VIDVKVGRSGRNGLSKAGWESAQGGENAWFGHSPVHPAPENSTASFSRALQHAFVAAWRFFCATSRRHSQSGGVFLCFLGEEGGGREAGLSICIYIHMNVYIHTYIYIYEHFVFYWDGYSRPTRSLYNRPASWSQWALCIEK